MLFEPHPQSDARRRSAVALIKYLLAEKKPEVLPVHYWELLSILLWKITESECHNKHSTCYQSKGALDCRTKLRHDHVFQRKNIITALEKAALREVDDILKRAIACTVTVDEHTRLSKYDRECDGWERYQKAGITVMDTATGKRFDPVLASWIASDSN